MTCSCAMVGMIDELHMESLVAFWSAPLQVVGALQSLRYDCGVADLDGGLAELPGDLGINELLDGQAGGVEGEESQGKPQEARLLAKCCMC